MHGVVSASTLVDDRRVGSASVCGILDVQQDLQSTVTEARRMIAAGAQSLEVDGAGETLTVQQELARLLPVVDACAGVAPLAVRTSRPEVMREVAAVGAAQIIDSRALRHPDAVRSVARTDMSVCLTHRVRVVPQRDPRSLDVLQEMTRFLHSRISACVRAGIPRQRLLVEPDWGRSCARGSVVLAEAIEALAVLDLPVSLRCTTENLLDAVRSGARVVRIRDVATARRTMDAEVTR